VETHGGDHPHTVLILCKGRELGRELGGRGRG